MNQSLRVSLVDFLNARPLTWGLLQDPPPGVSVSRDVPAVCAEKLSRGEADAGLIPSIEFRRIPGLVRVEGLGIAADSEVRSVLLVSKVPRGKIRSVSLDPASRTSAVLTRLILRRVYGLDPEYRESAPDPVRPSGIPHPASGSLTPDPADAELVIGDPALKASLRGRVVLDLAAEWKSWTGFPFVFAFWAVRREAWREDLPGIFARAHRLAMEDFDGMVEAELATIASGSALSRAMVEDYLRHCLHYELTRADEEGLALFYRLAGEEGVLHPQEAAASR
jgi:chorismate dehydratase